MKFFSVFFTSALISASSLAIQVSAQELVYTGSYPNDYERALGSFIAICEGQKYKFISQQNAQSMIRNFQAPSGYAFSEANKVALDYAAEMYPNCAIPNR